VACRRIKGNKNEKWGKKEELAGCPRKMARSDFKTPEGELKRKRDSIRRRGLRKVVKKG